MSTSQGMHLSANPPVDSGPGSGQVLSSEGSNPNSNPNQSRGQGGGGDGNGARAGVGGISGGRVGGGGGGGSGDGDGSVNHTSWVNSLEDLVTRFTKECPKLATWAEKATVLDVSHEKCSAWPKGTPLFLAAMLCPCKSDQTSITHQIKKDNSISTELIVHACKIRVMAKWQGSHKALNLALNLDMIMATMVYIRSMATGWYDIVASFKKKYHSICDLIRRSRYWDAPHQRGKDWPARVKACIRKHAVHAPSDWQEERCDALQGQLCVPPYIQSAVEFANSLAGLKSDRMLSMLTAILIQIRATGRACSSNTTYSRDPTEAVLGVQSEPRQAGMMSSESWREVDGEWQQSLAGGVAAMTTQEKKSESNGLVVPVNTALAPHAATGQAHGHGGTEVEIEAKVHAGMYDPAGVTRVYQKPFFCARRQQSWLCASIKGRSLTIDWLNRSSRSMGMLHVMAINL